MKVQNTCTIEQAQSLDKDILEAGLEWPGIDWEKGCRFHANWGWRISSYTTIKGTIPVPTLAELAKMIPPNQATEPDSMVMFHPRRITVGNVLSVLMSFIRISPELLKAHWETLK